MTGINQALQLPILEQRNNEAATKIQALFRGRSVRNLGLILKLKYESCVVCRENFNTAERVTTFLCGGRHILHNECAQRLAAQSGACPYCREENTNPFWRPAHPPGEGGAQEALRAGQLIAPGQQMGPFRQAAVFTLTIMELLENLYVMTRIATSIYLALVASDPEVADLLDRFQNTDRKLLALAGLVHPLENWDNKLLGFSGLASCSIFMSFALIIGGLVDRVIRNIELNHPRANVFPLYEISVLFRIAILLGAIELIDSVLGTEELRKKFGLGE